MAAEIELQTKRKEEIEGRMEKMQVKCIPTRHEPEWQSTLKRIKSHSFNCFDVKFSATVSESQALNVIVLYNLTLY